MSVPICLLAGPVESVANLIEKSPDILSRLKNVVSGFKGGKENDKEGNTSSEGARKKICDFADILVLF